MILYLLDYHGALDTLPSPVDYIDALRAGHNYECMVIVISGGLVPQSLVESADDFWSKNDSFHARLKELYANGWREAFVCDDTPLVTRACVQTLQKLGFQATPLHPDDLMTLIV